MEKLREAIEKIISLILPKKDTVSRIENMDTTRFVSTVSLATPDPHIPYHALFAYRDPIMKQTIWEIKYHKNKKITKLCAILLYEHILGELGEQITQTHEKPLLVSIPRSSDRVQEYGYDQGKLLRDAIKKQDHAGLFLYPAEILKKIKHTLPQSKINERRKRLANMHDSFQVCVILPKNAHVILIDDVATTGATLEAASEALRQAGAKYISCFALAH